MKKITYTVVIATLLTPFITYAAPLGGLTDLIKAFGGIVNLLIPLVFGLALVFFFWGTAQFILNAGDTKTRDEGKNKMLWGIVALFVMVSIYGILRFIGSTIGVGPQQTQGGGGGGLSGDYTNCGGLDQLPC